MRGGDRARPSDSLHRAIAIIPARGGSKGIPGKNLRPVGGVPLLARTIGSARASDRIGAIYVSSDNAEILALASEHGAVPVTRPAGLAGDASSSEAAVLHALPYLAQSAEIIVLLQCTSPFTKPSDITRLVAALDDLHFNSALTVIDDHSFLWTANGKGEGTGINHDAAVQRARRQDLPPQYRESGQGYAFRRKAFEVLRTRFCPPVALVRTTHPPLEIDEPLDLVLAECIATILGDAGG